MLGKLKYKPDEVLYEIPRRVDQTRVRLPMSHLDNVSGS